MNSPLPDKLNFRCLSYIKNKLPPQSLVHSFLCYSAHLELGLASAGHYVAAHTVKYPIYEFWHSLLSDPARVHTLVEHLYPFESVHAFEALQESWPSRRGQFMRSALFYLLIACSSQLSPSHGEFRKSALTPMMLRRLKYFSSSKFYVMWDDSGDYLNSFSLDDGSHIALFPVGKYTFNLFEEGKSRGPECTLVNHQKLKEKLEGSLGKWIVVYKYHPRVLKEYKHYNITMISKYGQPTKHEKMCEDIVIANF